LSGFGHPYHLLADVSMTKYYSNSKPHTNILRWAVRWNAPNVSEGQCGAKTLREAIRSRWQSNAAFVTNATGSVAKLWQLQEPAGSR
jgi:hypothetical protein